MDMRERGRLTAVELSPEGGGKAACDVRLSVHRSLDGIVVFHDERDLRVAIALKTRGTG